MQQRTVAKHLTGLRVAVDALARHATEGAVELSSHDTSLIPSPKRTAPPWCTQS